jgi:hypothetical protein
MNKFFLNHQKQPIAVGELEIQQERLLAADSSYRYRPR